MMIEKAVDRCKAEIDDNRFLEVTCANGDKEAKAYFKDFNLRAMIRERRVVTEPARTPSGALRPANRDRGSICRFDRRRARALNEIA